MGRVNLMFVLAIMAAFLTATIFYNLSVSKAEDEGEKISIAPVMERLQEVLRNQQEIMKKLDDIKSELYVVKIRATK